MLLTPYLFVICMNILSKLLDKAAVKKQFGYHPRCKRIHLTNLCFVKDLMVFVDGDKRSTEGVIKKFDDFTSISSLRISLEKSTLFMACLNKEVIRDITFHFPLSTRNLPIRYLGLPLLSKRMSVADYKMLLEKIRKRLMQFWTGRLISYAGCLLLLKYVISNITNFWSQAFRLPTGCMKEIEKLCSAFLWSGPELTHRKIRVSWTEFSIPKAEGGLRIRRLKDTNKVICLKLLWKILSSPKSLWVSWIKNYVLCHKSIWAVNENVSSGSWVFRKLLKYRDITRTFHRIEVHDGLNSSFLFDNWSPLGRLEDLTRNCGHIYLGISSTCTLSQVFSNHRRKTHRCSLLNEIKEAGN